MSSASNPPALLDVKHVSKTYGGSTGFRALDDVSMYVAERECVGLIGASGSGKSTLSNIIAGFVEPDSGVVAFDGAAIGPHADGRARAARREAKQAWLGMRMVFQNPEASFLPSMRLGKAVLEGIRYLPGSKPSDRDVLVNEAFDAVGLPASYIDRYPFEVSGGECQRAAIARAIIGRPKLIICDEPTSALDVTVQAGIMRLLADIHERFGTSFLFISHNIALVNEFCSRIYKIEDGRIVVQLEACDSAARR